MLTRKQLYGLDFISDTGFTDIVDEIIQYRHQPANQNQQLPLLITPNVDDIVKFNRVENSAIATAMQKSAFILPDGQFIVWSSWLLGRPLKKRLPGSDLFPALWEKLKSGNKQILLIAPDQHVGKLLQQEYNNLTYYVPPFFDEKDADALHNVIQQCISEIEKCNPDLVFIGIRFPKQHYIALKSIEHIQTKPVDNSTSNKMPLFLLLGASFEFYLGIKKRAPKIIRFMGMEWFHRFAQEPRRLFRRFFIEDMAFFPIFWKEMFK
ncbi:MAG: WecB/TagA/CpsF family glycosyltransferase [Bacteroidetes bacterium]|nr:WecB/TagA/CpsF family glycosyltransferase [Bacteroidota bacterium]